MKPILKLAVLMLISPALISTSYAGSITTTKTTTVVTTTTTGCAVKKHYKKKYKKRHYTRCSTYRCSGAVVYDNWDYCPGGAYNCYYDLQGVNYRQSYYPISYEHNVAYSCLDSEDPASCS